MPPASVGIITCTPPQRFHTLGWWGSEKQKWHLKCLTIPAPTSRRKRKNSTWKVSVSSDFSVRGNYPSPAHALQGGWRIQKLCRWCHKEVENFYDYRRVWPDNNMRKLVVIWRSLHSHLRRRRRCGQLCCQARRGLQQWRSWKKVLWSNENWQ